MHATMEYASYISTPLWMTQIYDVHGIEPVDDEY